MHNNNSAREWYERLGMEACRWWERGGTGWELKGEGLYVPEEPAEGAGAEGGLIMRASGGALDSALQRRYEHRGNGAADISYHIIKNSAHGPARIRMGLCGPCKARYHRQRQLRQSSRRLQR